MDSAGSSSSLYPRCVDTISSLCPHMVTLLCCVCVCTTSYKDTGRAGLEPTLATSFYPNHLFKDSISKYSPEPMGWGVGASAYEFLRETQLSP